MTRLTPATMLALAASLIVLLPARAVPQDPPGPPANERRPDSGVQIPDWTVRFDQPAIAIENLYVRRMGLGMHVTTRFAAILWKPDPPAAGRYAIVSSFTSQSSAARPQAFGVFIGGSDLGGGNQKYTAFVVRQDGRFLIIRHDGVKSAPVVDWTDSAAVNTPDADGDLYNDLTVHVDRAAVTFLVNEREVATRPASDVDTTGLAGLRVLDDADVHVADFRVLTDNR